MTTPAEAWLPPLVTLDQHGGDWPTYLTAIYALFTRDFLASKPRFPGKRMGLKRLPIRDGKEATFWHLVSEGKVEEERLPDLRRCERIGWPRPMIDELTAFRRGGARVHCWVQPRPGVRRIVIAAQDFSYVVILDDRGDFVLPWTAFYVHHTHQRDRFRREWASAQTHQKAGAAPWEDGPVTPATPGG